MSCFTILDFAVSNQLFFSCQLELKYGILSHYFPKQAIFFIEYSSCHCYENLPRLKKC